MDPAPWNRSHGGSHRGQREGTASFQALPDDGVSIGDPLLGRKAHLMKFLLYKYRMRQLTTKKDMLFFILTGYEQYFDEVFQEVSRSMYLGFGIEVKEVDPPSQLYVVIPALGLTYDGIGDDYDSFPKISLLIFVLGAIFFQGNRASEELIWEVLSEIGVCPGRNHVICGEPRKFIMEDLVQEGYLGYRQVSGSNPAQYEFLWGARARAETSKMKVLEYLAKVKRTTPDAFPRYYEEALRDELGEVQHQGTIEMGSKKDKKVKLKTMICNFL